MSTAEWKAALTHERPFVDVHGRRSEGVGAAVLGRHRRCGPHRGGSPMTIVAIMLAAAGACCYAFGAWLQHAGVGVATNGGGFRFSSLLRLFRTPRWLLG